MTRAARAHTAIADSAAAGRELGLELRRGLDGAAADAIIVFASAQHDYHALLGALADAAGTTVIVGASSAGEFTDAVQGEGSVSALALCSDSMRFAVGIGHDITRDVAAAAREVVASFHGLAGEPLPYRSALVMTDALAGHADALVEELTLATGGNHQFFGGGAGDDGRFASTHVFAGTAAATNAVAALEIMSREPVGIGVSHGWVSGGRQFRVTEADGSRLVSLNGLPASAVFEEFAEATGQHLDTADPLPFFLHNIIGIESGSGFRLRVPLGIGADGSVACAADVPEGAIVHIMRTSNESATKAAENATRAALAAMGGRPVSAALMFDCVATRLRTGRAFESELKACAALLPPTGFAGCNTYGQIARAEGQFSGFHNCTAVVCVLPA